MIEKKPSSDPPGKAITGKQAYNVVTDTVAGPNLRVRDNLYQGLAILICLVLGVGIGYLMADFEGVIIGAFIGLVVGLLGSGIFLMIYRGVQHARGRHD